MSACPECEGTGEICVEEGPSWWLGSGVYVNEYPCPLCQGETDLPDEPAEDEGDPEEEWKHAEAQSLIDWQTATVETFGLVCA